MENKRLYSPARIREIMTQFQFTTSKALGQNFLTDGNVVRRIADALDIVPGERILEIGPGIGVLTEELCLRGAEVTAVELDERLLPILSETVGHFSNFRLVHGDILRVNLAELSGGRPIKVVGNLPYYVTTPIITALLPRSEWVSSVVIMMQREVAQRILAERGSAEYGSLSLFCQYYSDPERVMRVKKTVFLPPPKVDSEVLKLSVKVHEDSLREKPLFELIRAAFSQRRKTLINALSSAELGVDKQVLMKVLARLDWDPKVRGEDLGIEDFECLLTALEDSAREEKDELLL